VLRDAPAELVLASQSGGYVFLDATDTQESVYAAHAVQRFKADRSAREDLADTLCFAEIDAGDFDGAMCIGQASYGSSPGLHDSCSGLISTLLASGKPVVVIPEGLAPASASNGLLIAGNRARSPIIAAHALIGALRPCIDAADGKIPEWSVKLAHRASWQRANVGLGARRT
jgi:hypothetical protein